MNANHPYDKPYRQARAEFEKTYLEYHLAIEGGSVARVAAKAGLERTHTNRKIKQLGIHTAKGINP